MGYSRNRLVLIAGFWLVLGGVFFLFNPPSGVMAEGSCGLENGPCQFPAEHYEGGIIMGAGTLDGSNLLAEGFPSGDGTIAEAQRPNSADTEPVIGAGLNGLSVNDFYLYKSWRDYDWDTNQDESYYIWLEANPGQISGSSECTFDNPRTTCDLYGEVTEVSAGNLEATIEGCFLVCPITNSRDDYWIISTVQDDNCGAIDALVSGGVCLGLLAPGLAQSLGDVSATISDTKFRVHKLQAQQQSDGTHKVIQFQDVYAEIRYGTGYDRIKTTGVAPLETSGGGRRQAAVSNNFDCDGNPDWNPNCNPDADESGSPPSGQDEAYIDIHR